MSKVIRYASINKEGEARIAFNAVVRAAHTASYQESESGFMLEVEEPQNYTYLVIRRFRVDTPERLMEHPLPDEAQFCCFVEMYYQPPVHFRYYVYELVAP